MKKLTALLLLLPVLVSADPGPATKYLINEPASLMDVAILSLQISLDKMATSMKTKGQHLSLRAHYDFSDDKIILSASVFFRGENAQHEAKEICDAQIYVLGALATSDMEQYFSHAGFVRGDPPADFVKKLQERTELRCFFQIEGEPVEYQGTEVRTQKTILTAHRMLLDDPNDIAYLEKD